MAKYSAFRATVPCVPTKSAKLSQQSAVLLFYIYIFGWNSKNREKGPRFSAIFCVPTCSNLSKVLYMAPLNPETLATFERKAAEGDGLFAIAFALLRLDATSDQFRRDLCFGEDVGSTRVPGVLEKIAMELASNGSPEPETIFD